MALKRAYLIIVLSFAWLIGCVILGMAAGSLLGNQSTQGLAIVIGAVGCEIGLTIGVCEVALAKGYSIWLGIVLGFSGFVGIVIVELLPNRWESPRS
jgi:hypothetical protein